jgi:hypothetical protein
MKKIIFAICFFALASCSSTGQKNINQLGPDSKSQANIYIKRLGGYVLGGTRAIVRLNGQDVGSLYTNEFLKVYANPGNSVFTIAGDKASGVFGKTDLNVNFKAGDNYYFVVSVSGGKGIGIFLGGAIGQAATGGPFQVLRVNREGFYGNTPSPSRNKSVKPEADEQTFSSKKNNQSKTGSLADEIEKLNKLYKSGAISKEEYDKAKTKLLN